MKIFIIGVVCFFVSAQAFAARYYVGEIRNSEANVSLNQSLRALISSSITSAGQSVASDEKSADYELRTDVIRLGEAYVVTVSKYHGETWLISSKQKAASLEQLDDASDRAVRAAILGTQTKKDLRVGEVKQEDEHRLEARIRSHNTNYFGFGASGLTNMGDSKFAYDFGLGHNWEVTPRAQIKVLGEIFAASDWSAYLADVQLGLNLFLTDEDTSPYLGVGLGFGGSGAGSGSDATTVGGFAGSVGLGLQFFRTSSTQFDIYASYTSQFVNNNVGTPGAFGLRIGVLY